MTSSAHKRESDLGHEFGSGHKLFFNQSIPGDSTSQKDDISEMGHGSVDARSRPSSAVPSHNQVVPMLPILGKEISQTSGLELDLTFNLNDYAKDGVPAVNYQKQGEQEAFVKDFDACSTMNFFVKHSFRDIKRNKCNFCLSFCSILIVVMSALVVNTLTD